MASAPVVTNGERLSLSPMVNAAEDIRVYKSQKGVNAKGWGVVRFVRGGEGGGGRRVRAEETGRNSIKESSG